MKETVPPPEEWKPKVIAANGYSVPPDSMPKWAFTPMKLTTRYAAGKPIIVQEDADITTAAAPTLVQAGTPLKILPGTNGTYLPENVPFAIKSIPCINKPLERALDREILESNYANLQYLDLKHGLASGYILTIFQDKAGNLWIGTNGEGVIRYDGSFFTQYSGREGFPNNWVRNILQDKQGDMWFGTDGGLVRFDGRQFHLLVDQGVFDITLPRMDIRGLAQDADGNIWFGTARYGFFRFSHDSLTYFGDKQGLAVWMDDVYADKKGTVWLASRRNGLYKIDGKSFLNYTTSQGLVDNHVTTLAEDRNGDMWIGTEHGISKFAHTYFSNYRVEKQIGDNAIVDIHQDRSGKLWFGTNNNGILILDGVLFRHYTAKQGLTSNLVRCIFEDNTGTLWIGTYGGGISMLNEYKFRHYSNIIERDKTIVNSIFEDKAGNIWFRTMGGTLTKYDGKSFSIYPENKRFGEEVPTGFYQENDGRISFEGGGLWKFDGNTFSGYPLRASWWGCVIEDAQGNMWEVTENKADSASTVFFPPAFRMKFVNGFGGSYWTFCQDRNQTVWMGDNAGLITKFDGKTFTHYRDVIHAPISAITADSLGNVWIASRGDGLFRFNGKQFIQYTVQNGLVDNHIRSIIVQDTTTLWLGTDKGLNRFTYQPGKPDAVPKIRAFKAADGLLGGSFQPRAALLDSRGNAWWGTNKSVNVLNTKMIAADTVVPVVKLHAIRVNELHGDFHSLGTDTSQSTVANGMKSIQYARAENFGNYPVNPVLPYHLNHLTFLFSATDWSAPDNLQYSYRVEGLDNAWSQLSYANYADYRNMPYGNYTFKVKAIGMAQQWSNVFEYRFTINPPWWHTWWFRFLVAGVCFLSVSRYLKYRTRSLLQRQEHLQRTVQKRTEQLRVSLIEKESLLKEIHHRVKNNLEVMSSLLKLQTKNVTDESAKAALMEGQSRVQSIALIHHKLYSSNDLANIDIIDFAKGLFAHIRHVFMKPGETVHFTTGEQEVTVDTDTAVPIGLILNELFTNAFKYALQPNRENTLRLQIRETVTGGREMYEMTFADNGTGMPEGFSIEHSGSLGMKVIQLLTRQLGGTLRYYNKDGAVFEICFPKANDKPAAL